MALDEKQGKMEEIKPLLAEEKPIHIEVHHVGGPKESKLDPNDIPLVIKPPERLVKKVSPKETTERKEERTVVSHQGLESGIGISPKTERKGSPFFKLLFVLSFVLVAVAVGLLLLPLLNVPIPAFLTSAIDLVSR